MLPGEIDFMVNWCRSKAIHQIWWNLLECKTWSMLWRVVLDSEMGSYFLDLKVHFDQVIGDFSFCFCEPLGPIWNNYLLLENNYPLIRKQLPAVAYCISFSTYKILFQCWKMYCNYGSWYINDEHHFPIFQLYNLWMIL